MIRRPLAAMLLASICISLILVFIFPGYIYPDCSLEDGARVSFTCRIVKVEKKRTGRCNIFVRRGRFTLLLIADSESEIADIRIGNRITVYCRYVNWHEPRNKGNYDERKYYRSLGVYQKYILEDHVITESSFNLFSEIMRSFRRNLERSIESCADEETAGIIQAMVTGTKTGMHESSNSLFRMSGIVHIFAVSGLHISLVGMGIFRLLKKRAGLNSSAFFAIMAAVLYSVMCGLSPSSVRACIMMAVNIGAKVAGRRYDMVSSLSLAGILLLASNPFYIINSAFILSFLAVIAIAILCRPSAAFITGRQSQSSNTGPFYIRKITETINTLSSSVQISLFTVPVIISMYYEFPLYAPVLNLLLVMIIPYILGGAIIGGIIGIVSGSAGRIIMGLPAILTKAVIRICDFVVNLPGNRICTGQISAIRIIFYYAAVLIVVLTVNILNRRNSLNNSSGKNQHKCIFHRTASRALLIMTVSVMPFIILIIRPDNKGITMSFIDVDQGECIFIMSENKNVHMFDAGSTTIDEVYRYRIESTLKYHGIERIENIFVTHPDLDHISAVIDMLQDDGRGIEISNLIIAEYPGNDNYEKLIGLANKNNVNIISLHAGMLIRDGTLVFKCIHPASDFSAGDINDASAVFALEYGAFSAMITGDISSSIEKQLLDEGLCPENIDLLDVCHHGSATSSCTEFLERLSPEVSVISAGINNAYGHPHKDTLTRLERAGSDIYCTADCGEIDIKADLSGNMKISTFTSKTSVLY